MPDRNPAQTTMALASQLADKKVLILGASGFIGKNLYLRLKELQNEMPFEIYTSCLSGSFSEIDLQHHVHGDLTDRRFVKFLFDQREFDVVFQCAAVTSGIKDIVERPHLHVTNNAIMNSLVFEAAATTNVRHCIYLSCTVMYPNSLDLAVEAPLDLDQIHPTYFGVAHTKLYAERMCEFFNGRSNTTYTALRHSNVYGPHDKFDEKKSHFIGATVAKVARTEDYGELNVWGNGQSQRDFIYIDDLISAMIMTVDIDDEYIVYNIGSGERITINEVVELLVHISGKKLRLLNDLSKPSITMNTIIDSSRFQKKTGWAVQTPLENGLAETFDWYKRQTSAK